jgi:hypothetical protein
MIANLSMFQEVRFNMDQKVIGMITKDGALRFRMER